MSRRGIILMLLAMALAGSGQCTAIEIAASQDVYVSLGTGNETVHRQSDTLLCAITVPDANNTTLNSYPGVPVIQFNLSGINITGDDVAILVLKAASVRQMDRSSIVALVAIGSDWDEQSDLTTFLVNILPARNLIAKNDLTLISTNSDGDSIYAFDVSQKLIQAKGKGDKVSFLLEAIGNNTTEIDFLSRESGQGPYLIILPYPGQPLSEQADHVVQADHAAQADRVDPILASEAAAKPSV
ncbi:MAG: DNRLRE domain-containing protein [Methanothrix sp.]|jgi:hypothetical protein|uniref:DNRLRE domain-containing protein n=4 Tax=Methanothrix sp. TaxID=90426 RepID=UPI001BD3D099|nr:DNRLRE domain-containing protein [Methanothrix sp.]MBK7385362.1 DNRLRE domain-containing protein [Methanothrix sp.]